MCFALLKNVYGVTVTKCVVAPPGKMYVGAHSCNWRHPVRPATLATPLVVEPFNALYYFARSLQSRLLLDILDSMQYHRRRKPDIARRRAGTRFTESTTSATDL